MNQTELITDILAVDRAIRCADAAAVVEEARAKAEDVQAKWLENAAKAFESIAKSVENGATSEDVQRAIEALAELKLDTQVLADSLESTMGGSLVEGAKAALKLRGNFKASDASWQTIRAVEFKPVEEAVSRISKKTPLGSMMNSDQWSRVAQEIKDRSFFSAKVEEVKFLSEMQKRITGVLDHSRDANGALSDRGRFVKEMSDLAESLGLKPADPKKQGGIEDVTSEARLRLIYDTQNAQAYGYANYKAGQDPDILDLYPAQELLRLEDRVEKRDWESIWTQAGGKIYKGRFVALKGDPIFVAISDFGTPYEPVKWGSGMGYEDVSRADAEQIGLLNPAQNKTPRPDVQTGFNDTLAASVEGVGPSLRDRMLAEFKGLITIEGDTVKWKK